MTFFYFEKKKKSLKEEEEAAMELELGFKLTRPRDDDQTSMANLRITKDPSGPIFVSEETDSKFILTGHLKGFSYLTPFLFQFNLNFLLYNLMVNEIIYF